MRVSKLCSDQPEGLPMSPADHQEAIGDRKEGKKQVGEIRKDKSKEKKKKEGGSERVSEQLK